MQVMAQTARNDLYELVDGLPEQEVETARRFLEYLCDHSEALSAEELAQLDDDVAVSLSEAKAGRTHSAADVLTSLRTQQ